MEKSKSVLSAMTMLYKTCRVQEKALEAFLRIIYIVIFCILCLNHEKILLQDDVYDTNRIIKSLFVFFFCNFS